MSSVGDEEYCADCPHPKSNHNVRGDGKCHAELLLDKNSAPTKQQTFCTCVKFVPRQKRMDK